MFWVMNGRGRIIMYSVIDIIRAITPFVFWFVFKDNKGKENIYSESKNNCNPFNFL